MSSKARRRRARRLAKGLPPQQPAKPAIRNPLMIYTLPQPAPPPHMKKLPPLNASSTLHEVAARLHAVSIDVQKIALNVQHYSNRVEVVPEALVTPRDPMYTDYHGTGKIRLLGGQMVAETPGTLITAAKRVILSLLEHEIDEALFAAGLGRDPHSYMGPPPNSMIANNPALQARRVGLELRGPLEREETQLPPAPQRPEPVQEVPRLTPMRYEMVTGRNYLEFKPLEGQLLRADIAEAMKKL